MIPLIGFSIGKTAIGVLLVTLSLLICYIAYKKLLQYLGKGTLQANDYCVLYPVEQNPAKEILEIYFTTNQPKSVSIQLLNQDLSLHTQIENKNFGLGGHIIRYDINAIPDGNYFYALVTDNQKTVKKITIRNTLKDQLV